MPLRPDYYIIFATKNQKTDCDFFKKRIARWLFFSSRFEIFEFG